MSGEGGDSLSVSSLLNKLVEAGVINDGGGAEGGERHNTSSSPPPTPPPPPAAVAPGGPVLRRSSPPSVAPPITVPTLTFTPATLKTRFNSLVHLLHLGEQCPSCGLRFPSRSGPDYRSHLDWHFKENRREAEGGKKTSRNWFLHPDDWLKIEALGADVEEKGII